MEPDAFKIKTEIFEGPLDLLINLVEKRKLFINDFSLAKVTDDFIEYIKNYSDFPIAKSANFILTASTLMLIKSKSLLPNLSLTTEEEVTIADLEERLKVYQKFKEISFKIKNIFGKNIIFSKNNNKNITPIFSPDESITKNNIKDSILRVIENLPKKEIAPKATVSKIISLEETIIKITERINKAVKMNFSDFSSKFKKNGSSFSQEDKVNIIVGFLAILELVKQGVVKVDQKNLNSDIEIESSVVGIPNYQN